MSRWFRLSDDVINDPKILKMPEAMRWHWIAVLCIASKNDGALPSTADIAISLRVKPSAASAIIAGLKNAGLLDYEDGEFTPHNWSGRQYKNDVTDPTAAERMKRYRKNKRNDRNDTVTDKRPEAEAEADNSEARASGAVAPIDFRKRLFDEGLKTVARISGKGPDACRSFVGKCLSAAGDDAVIVLGLIEDAERNQTVDPCAWIVARLKPAGTSNGQTRSRIIQAADDLSRKIASFDGPAGQDFELRDATGAASPRLLSHG